MDALKIRGEKIDMIAKRAVSLISIVAMIITIAFPLVACNRNNTLLDPQKPTTLTMWHVYGEQVNSPMNDYVEQFNATVGKEKGIIINVTQMSNASQIGKKLKDAQAGKSGSPDMPDLFFCHASDAKDLGTDNLLNWRASFSQSELDAFVPGFLDDGTVDDSLCVFPVSKSTYMLFVAGGVFDRFAADRNVSLSDLETWEGFFTVAKKYYEWSGGKPFCAIDYLIRLAELCAISDGENISYKDGWYDANNAALTKAYNMFVESIAKGHIVVSDMYSNTQVMTGQTCAGIGSSASVLYYNDQITYPDNTSEDMNLQVLPMPQQAGKQKVATQSGVGLCAYKTTSVKAEAATVFTRWFTEEQRNLDFVLSTGYMPVRTGAFGKIRDCAFSSDAYKNLYDALSVTVATCTFEKEPKFDGYYSKVYALYDQIRKIQSSLEARYEKGETYEQIVAELRAALHADG